MLKGLLPRNRPARREWVRRLDRTLGDLNVLLVALAIGLATLDLTFLVTQRLVDRLPQLTRVFYAEDSSASRGSVADHATRP